MLEAFDLTIADSDASESSRAGQSATGGDAFTQTRLMPTFRVSTGLHVEHRRRLAMLHMKVC